MWPNIKFSFALFDNANVIDIKHDAFIGSGVYGEVYYLGKIKDTKCVIKITKSTGKYNEYVSEYHFYKKHHENNNNSVPRAIKIGCAINLLNMKQYDYLILEYVGFFSLKKILDSIHDADEEEKQIFAILYKSLNIQLKFLHKSNITLRDITPGNIVLNDKIGYYFAKKYFTLGGNLNATTNAICECKTCFSDIIELFNNEDYNNIAKFVDMGVAFDINELYKTKIYNKENKYAFCSFVNLYGLEGLFASTLTYISPFCMMNLIDILNSSLPDDILIISKDNISAMLKIADVWSLNILFLICLHDGMNKNKYLKKKQKYISPYAKKYNEHISENTFIYMPFTSYKTFSLNIELTLNEYFFEEQMENIYNTIMQKIEIILHIANNIRNNKIWTPNKIIIAQEYTHDIIYEIQNNIKQINMSEYYNF